MQAVRWRSVGVVVFLYAVVTALPVAAGSFRNLDNTPFRTRCNGPQGAIEVTRQPGVMNTQALGRAVYAQHRPMRLAAAAASVERLRRHGLVGRRPKVCFPRTVVHTLNGRLVQPDLLRTSQTGGLGDPTNNLTFTFQGWSSGDQAALESYLQTALPKARLIYGPPAFNLTVKIIQDDTLQELQGGTYDAATNEIRLPPLSGNFPEDTYVLLMLVLNAFHDDALLFYDAWEQGLIGAAAYVIQTQPGVSPGYDPIDPGPFYALSVYEPQNQPELGNSTFYPASGAANMLVWRIAMARAAWLKCWIENQQFFSQFNRLYYDNYTAGLPGDVPSLKELAALAVPTVEGLPFSSWYEQQYVLDTSVRLGAKLFTWNIPLVESVALITELYETLPDGDERPFGGQARTIYWNHEFNIQLYAEEGNLISIPAGGSTPGEGFLLPTFYNIGGPTRVTVQVDVSNLRRLYPFPYGLRGFDPGENNLYGAVVGANAGTLDVQGGNGLSGKPVDRGAWGGRVTTGALGPMQVTVTFTNSAGQPLTRRRNIGWDSYCCLMDAGSQVTRSHTFTYDLTGLHLMSLPLAPLQPDAAAALGIPAEQLLLAWWDPLFPGDNKYRLWPSFPFRSPGRAFWWRVLQDTTVTLQGLQADETATHTLPLEPGWNLIGSPRLADVALADLQVQVGENQAVTWPQAVTNRVVQNGVYGYTQAGGYETRDTLAPWEGYWVRCLEPNGAFLLFPPVTQSAAMRTLARAGSDLSWRLPLVVQAGKLHSAAAYVGAAPKAQAGADPFDLAAPPSFGPYAHVRFKHSDWGSAAGAYLSDIRPAEQPQQRWELEVACTLPRTRVQLTWPDLTSLPQALRPVLTDPATGKRLYLRTTKSYAFTTGATGGIRQLVLETQSTAPPLTLTGLTASGGRVHAALSYRLSADAAVTARVLNMAGRHIRTLTSDLAQTAGVQSLSWNLRDDRGQKAPLGRYLTEVTARATDGQQVRAVAGVVVSR